MRKKIWIKRIFLLLVSVWLMTLLVLCSPKVYNAENIDQLYRRIGSSEKTGKRFKTATDALTVNLYRTRETFWARIT